MGMATKFKKSLKTVHYNVVPRVHSILGQRLFVRQIEISGYFNDTSAESFFFFQHF